MEVEQRLRGRIVRRPKEQVWMLKTDSVKAKISIKNITIMIEWLIIEVHVDAQNWFGRTHT